MEASIASFIDYLRYERGASAATRGAYKNDLLQFVAFVRGHTENGKASFGSVDSDLIRLWVASLMDGHKSPTSVNRKLSALKSYFKYLMKQGLVLNNPASLVIAPKFFRPLPQIMKEDELAELLDGSCFKDDFIGIRDRLMMELLYETGLRRQELAFLKCSDIDLMAMVVRVCGKRNKERIVPFSERLKVQIISYLQKRRSVLQCDNTHFFVCKNGRSVAGATIYNVVRKYVSNRGLRTKCAPHMLRHSFATSLLNNGAELNAVKELLGHSSLSSTSIYTHIDFDKLKEMYYAHPRANR